MSAEPEQIYLAALGHLERWELDQAEELLRRLIELDPEHARALNKLGVVLARRKDFRQAEICFKEALGLDPHLASARSNLGNIYAERGWHDRAKNEYEQALRLDPGNPTATHNLGVLYRKQGQIGRGVELLKQASRYERRRDRSHVPESSQNRKTSNWVWLVVLVVGAILFLLWKK